MLRIIRIQTIAGSSSSKFDVKNPIARFRTEPNVTIEPAHATASAYVTLTRNLKGSVTCQDIPGSPCTFVGSRVVCNNNNMNEGEPGNEAKTSIYWALSHFNILSLLGIVLYMRCGVNITLKSYGLKRGNIGMA